MPRHENVYICTPLVKSRGKLAAPTEGRGWDMALGGQSLHRVHRVRDGRGRTGDKETGEFATPDLPDDLLLPLSPPLDRRPHFVFNNAGFGLFEVTVDGDIVHELPPLRAGARVPHHDVIATPANRRFSADTSKYVTASASRRRSTRSWHRYDGSRARAGSRHSMPWPTTRGWSE